MTDQAPQEGAAIPAAALTALWAGLRCIVVDVETLCHDKVHRVIEVGVVTCRAGKVTATWTQRVNPGLPVDPATFKVHGILTEELDGEPDFAEVEPELTRRLRGLDDETVVFVAHNASGDASALRHEYKLLGLEVPELRVLDTMRLPGVVGVRTGKALGDFLATLGVTNERAHSGLGDARATAEALLLMLVRAAEQGWTDFEQLYAKTMTSRAASTRTMRAPRRRDDADDELELDIDLPVEHTDAHAVLLTSGRTKELTAWQAELLDCARLRCPYAADRVADAVNSCLDKTAHASLTLQMLRTTCEQALTSLLGQDTVDAPAVATLLGAMSPLHTTLPDRAKALAWHDKWLSRLRTVRRCDRNDKQLIVCPECRAGEACPLDSWPQAVAEAALGNFPGQTLKSFLHLTGEKQGEGVLTTWQAKDRRLLCDAAAWLAFTEHRRRGNLDAARTFARYAYLAGIRDPQLMAAYASVAASAGGDEQLQRGIDVCLDAFEYRSRSTLPGWTELGAKRRQLQGWQERRRFRGSGVLDDEGNEIPVRRHHPETPRRTRPRRFAHPAAE